MGVTCIFQISDISLHQHQKNKDMKYIVTLNDGRSFHVNGVSEVKAFIRNAVVSSVRNLKGDNYSMKFGLY